MHLFSGNIFSSIPLIAIACMKCDINVVIVCLLSFAILKSCNMYGSPMGIVDISPKFCGKYERHPQFHHHYAEFSFLFKCNYKYQHITTENVSGILEGICGTLGSIQIFIFSTIISHYSGTLVR